MKRGTYDNPLKWLLSELPSVVDPAPLAELMARYEENAIAYRRQIAIRHAKRIIGNYERFHTTAENQRALTRWRAKLAKLESEQSG